MQNRITPPRNAAQPGISSTHRLYGNHKLIPTIEVRLRDDPNDRVVTINESDFDPNLHEKVE